MEHPHGIAGARAHGQVRERRPYAAPAGPRDWESFAARLRSVGGEPSGPVAPDALADTLQRLVRAWTPGGRNVVSEGLAARLPQLFERIPRAADPATLADVDVAVLAGSLGVAENGAVALDGVEAQPRALPFLCQRLVLVLDVDRIVADMHAAIAALPGDATEHHHYTWISGPSKTRDIEELVLGAHGPVGMAVVGVQRVASAPEIGTSREG